MQEVDEILKKVCRSIDILISAADEYEGLFPSILDLDTLKMPDELPPKIPGQRNEDRSHPGSNLMHDHPLLNTMYGLGRALSRPEYIEAADRYLRRFAVHCTNTTTGLFPWGEHSFWNIREDRIGNSFPLAYSWWKDPAIHDHLRAVPFWLWEKLYQYNPECVQRFAEGLDYHFKEGEPAEYTRHAYIEVRMRPVREGRSFDFPRHGGHYIMDWAFAYAKTGREDFLGQIIKMVDYWWPRRSPTGMLPLESRTPKHIDVIYNKTSPGQTMSLAMSLLETAQFMESALANESPIADKKVARLIETMRERGKVYAGSFLSLPHDLEKGIYVSCTCWDSGEICSTMTSWGSSYGTGTSCGMASACLGIYRMTGDERFFRWAESVGNRYLDEPFPQDVTVPISDVGTAVSLLTDLYEISGEKKWLEGGLKLAGELMPVYFDRDLPRGEASVDFYDSQMGPASLLHSLARIALLSQKSEGCPIEADYSGR